MPRVLPNALGADVLPVAELCAASRDGDLMRIDDGFVCVDEPDRAELRAELLALELPRVPAARHLIVMGWSAAWVFGALDHPPWQLEVCVRADERASLWLPPRFRLRELRLTDPDEIRVAGLRVTTPARTLRELAGRGPISPDLGPALARLELIAASAAGQPPLTR